MSTRHMNTFFSPHAECSLKVAIIAFLEPSMSNPFSYNIFLRSLTLIVLISTSLFLLVVPLSFLLVNAVR